jgi:hypothetical protein
MSLFHLRTADSRLLGLALAYKRVARGIKFLDKHAPKDWYLRFFMLYPSGGYRCRARDSYDNECALALAIAFESDPRFANEFGYVTYASVLNRFGVDPFLSESRISGFTRSRGFSDDETFSDFLRKERGEPKKRGHIVTGDMLDKAWSDSVLDIHRDRLLSPKHYSAYDRMIDRGLDTAMENLGRTLRKEPGLLDWLKSIGRKRAPA